MFVVVYQCVYLWCINSTIFGGGLQVLGEDIVPQSSGGALVQ